MAIHTHIERGELAARPRTPLKAQASITTTAPETLIAAVTDQRNVIYHITLSNGDSDLATVTVKFGSSTVFVFYVPADGGNVLCNFYGTELSTDFNEAFTVTLGASGVLSVTVCYIQSGST